MSYTTDSSAARQVFAAIDNDTYGIVRHAGRDYWIVERWSAKKQRFLRIVEAPTDCEAICLAALQRNGIAVEVGKS